MLFMYTEVLYSSLRSWWIVYSNFKPRSRDKSGEVAKSARGNYESRLQELGFIAYSFIPADGKFGCEDVNPECQM